MEGYIELVLLIAVKHWETVKVSVSSWFHLTKVRLFKNTRLPQRCDQKHWMPCLCLTDGKRGAHRRTVADSKSQKSFLALVANVSAKEHK